jgi:menaquinone-dependent protoporphyrinogen oxidase
MPDAILLTYATRDGQARRIAERIRDRLSDSLRFAARDLKHQGPSAAELSSAKLLIVVAAVRYGKHLPEADQMLSAYAKLPNRPLLALASVNLTARKPGKTTVTGSPYLRKLIARHHLTPVVAAAFAGRLEYRRYRWFDRQLIRFIMLLTGGPIDLSTSIEYTDWAAVDVFADQINLIGQAE